MTIFETWEGTLIFFVCLLAGAMIFALFSFFIVSHILFTMHLKRTRADKWTRECSEPDPEQQSMYDTGVEWSKEHASAMQELHMVNEGLNLYAEYYDFGYDKAVIIVPGRTEGLRYGYYFAKPYAESGYNVLTVDQRAHGNSDGLYNTIGFEEHKDVLLWAARLHDELGIKEIVLHGICIGASCSMFAITSEQAPDYIVGLVAEGMYPTFYESFKNHMIELKKPIFPCLQLVDMWMKHYTGHTMKYGPLYMIHQLKAPLLMLHSKEDAYSLPSAAQRLYETCPSEQKELVWFEHGAHSRLRITDSERYDTAISAFLEKHFSKNAETLVKE